MRLASHKYENHRGKINLRTTQNKLNIENLKEVENLLVKVDDIWNCKVCGKTSLTKIKLRYHAEIHVDGFRYQCQHCRKIFPTRTRLWNHNRMKHSDVTKSSAQNSQPDIKSTTKRSEENAFNDLINEISKTNEKKNKETDNDKKEEKESKDKAVKTPDKISDLHQQKLKEVEELLVSENGHWKCKECNITSSAKGNLRMHAEIHVSGLNFPCKHCRKIFTTRVRLATHKHRKHRNKHELKI